jgi:CDP-diacylglycerol--glycerol-3-phosphate 3-phosphatidyltransferase
MPTEVKLTFYDKVIRLFLPIIPKKLKPNYITFFRLICAPIVPIFLQLGDNLTALIAFVVIASTDMLDGALARLRDQETEWGRIWDPVADKLLIGLIVVALLFNINLGLAILILTIELIFILGSVVKKIQTPGILIKANSLGKTKMVLQCCGAGLLMLSLLFYGDILAGLAQICLYVSLVFAIISLARSGI